MVLVGQKEHDTEVVRKTEIPVEMRNAIPDLS